MNSLPIEPIVETADSVTLSRADFEVLAQLVADAQELTDAETVRARLIAGFCYFLQPAKPCRSTQKSDVSRSKGLLLDELFLIDFIIVEILDNLEDSNESSKV